MALAPLFVLFSLLSVLVPGAAHAQKLTFTKIAPPPPSDGKSRDLVFMTGINDNNVAIGYTQSGSNYQNFVHHGLLYQNGKLTFFDGPLPTRPGQGTKALAINNAGQILIGQGTQYFLLSGPGGTFRPLGLKGTLTATGAAVTLISVSGLNDKGEIAGVYASGAKHGVYGVPALGPVGSTVPPPENGTYTQFDCPPGAGGLSETGALNDKSESTGNCAAGRIPGQGFASSQGFLVHEGTATTFFHPDSFGPQESVQKLFNTMSLGVTASGFAVGRYQFTQAGVVPFPFKGFVYDGSKFTTVLPPDASGSVAAGMNRKGIVVGYYYSPSDGGYYGFLTSPLIPPAGAR